MDLIEKINELINEITIEKLSSISGENKIKVEESIKTCVTTILYTLLNKNSEQLDTIVNVAKEVLEFPTNGQNYSILLKTIYGDHLEKILFDISKNTNTNVETIHLVANSAVVSVFKAIESLVDNYEVYFITNLLKTSQEKINLYLPAYVNKIDLESPVTYKQITSPLAAENVYDKDIK